MDKLILIIVLNINTLIYPFADIYLSPQLSKDFGLYCRIVESEASVLDFDAKVAVAHTVYNRLQSDHFPNTLEEVSKGFSTKDNGDISEETIEAVSWMFEYMPYPEDMVYFCSDNAHNYGYDYITFKKGKYNLTFRTEVNYNETEDD